MSKTTRTNRGWLVAAVYLAASLGCDGGDAPNAHSGLADTAERLVVGEVVDVEGNPVLPAGLNGECELHHEAFGSDEVPIIYGIPFQEPPGFEVGRERMFWNASSVYFGGCIIGMVRKASVSYCSACRTAEVEWESVSAAAGAPRGMDLRARNDARREAGLKEWIPSEAH